MAKQEWFTPKQAAPLLGKENADAVRYWIRTRRAAGVLRAGYHYKDDGVPGAGRPTLLIHVERCQKIGDRATGRV